MDQERRNPILTIDVRVRLHGALYGVAPTKLLKWLVAIGVLVYRVYRAYLEAPV